MTSRAGSLPKSVFSVVLASLIVASGCTLITAVDEDKIPDSNADAAAGTGGVDGGSGGSAGVDGSAGSGGTAGVAGAAGC